MAVMRDIQKKLRRLWPHLNERGRRMLAAAEAVDIGHGGVSLVSRASGLSRVTITKGISELGETPLAEERVRRSGQRIPDCLRRCWTMWRAADSTEPEPIGRLCSRAQR